MSDAPPQLAEVVDGLKDMPALPNVVAKLTRMISNPKTTAADINDTLSSDPGLVTKILKLVNSPYFGFSRRITSITNAVVILGYNQVRNLALSAFIFDKFADSGKGALFDVKGFWKHSIGTAFIGSRLAASIDPKLEEDGFICGLLHDLGKFVMLQRAEPHMAKVMTLVRKRDILFYAAEQECLGYNHAQLGAAVMERWNLPETLVEVVKNHHTPEAAPETARALTCVTSLADIVARSMVMGNGGDDKIPRLSELVWRTIGLTWPVLDSIMRLAAEDYSKSDVFFSI